MTKNKQDISIKLQRNLSPQTTIWKGNMTMSVVVALWELLTKVSDPQPSSQITVTSCHDFYPLNSSALDRKVVVDKYIMIGPKSGENHYTKSAYCVSVTFPEATRTFSCDFRKRWKQNDIRVCTTGSKTLTPLTTHVWCNNKHWRSQKSHKTEQSRAMSTGEVTQNDCLLSSMKMKFRALSPSGNHGSSSSNPLEARETTQHNIHAKCTDQKSADYILIFAT